MKFLTLSFGPEHEGRVAVGSPRDRDWAIGNFVLNQPVLREDSGRIRLGAFTIGYADQPITVVHERRFSRRYELRIFDGFVWQAWFWFKTKASVR